jgi:hypothetical protein
VYAVSWREILLQQSSSMERMPHFEIRSWVHTSNLFHIKETGNVEIDTFCMIPEKTLVEWKCFYNDKYMGMVFRY